MVQVEIVVAVVIIVEVEDVVELEDVVAGSMADIMRMMQSHMKGQVFVEEDMDTDKEDVEVTRREERL